MTLADQKESLQNLLSLHQQVLETAREYPGRVVLTFQDLPLPLDLEDEEPWRLHPEAWKAWQVYQRNRKLCSRIREARLRFLSLMDKHPKYPEEWLTMEVRLPFRAEGNCVMVGPLPPKRIAKVCRELEAELLRLEALARRVKETVSEEVEGLPPDDCKHSPDYRSVSWHGKQYTFTETQAACVRVLWENWEQGTPEVGQEAILEQADSDQVRLQGVFEHAKHPAWETMIVKGRTKGAYRLADSPKSAEIS